MNSCRQWCACLVAMIGIAHVGLSAPQEHPSVNVKRLTPVMVVDEIEPCLELWEKRLGFARTAEVPEKDRLGFVILMRDDIEIMYQTQSSLEQDLAQVAQAVRAGRQFLYIEVADLAAIEMRLNGLASLMQKRETFYGMREVIIRDPAGHVITFAQKIADRGG